MKISLDVAAICLAVLMAPIYVLAQTTPEQPLQELFQSATVYSQEKGESQVTFTSQFSKNSSRKLFEMPLAVEHGLTDKWVVSLEWSARNRFSSDDETLSGSGDLQLGTKYSWMNIRKSNVHVAAGFELGLPSGNEEKGFSEGETEYEPYVVVAKDFPGLSRLQLFNQLGVSFSSSGNELVWNSGFLVPYRQTTFTTELNLNREGGKNEAYLTPGIVWRLPRKVEIGVGVPFGLTSEADRFRTIVKLSYEFSLSRKSEK